MDFDGDGRNDIVFSYVNSFPQPGPNTFVYGLLSRGNSFHIGPGNIVPGIGYISGGIPALPVHWNDDACDDLQLGNQILLAACNGSYGGALTLTGGGTPGLALDWDGDGRTDLLVNVSGTWQLYRSEGNTVAPLVSTGISVGSGMWAVTDQNGDGLHDLVFANSAVSNALYYGLHNGGPTQPDLATSFTDGYGVTFRPSYLPLSQAGYFNVPEPFPEQNYNGPLNVVSSTAASDGIGGTYTTSYYYGSAVVNLQGRGFEGFGVIGPIDSRTGIFEYRYYNTSFPYTGMVTEDDFIQPTYKGLGTITNQLATLTLDGTAHNQRYFPYVSTSTIKSDEVGGALDGQLISTTVKSVGTPDNYGNFATVATTVADNDPTSPYYTDQWTSTTANTFTPSVADWCLKLPTETTVTNSSTAPGGTAITRTIQYNNPDYTNCRETEKVIEPNSATYKVVEDYGYDAFGNLHTDTVTGVGMAARATTITWNSTGQFPQTIQNPLLQSMTLAFDPNTGMKTSQTDPNYTTSNPLMTTWIYDNFARAVSESRPDGTSTTFSYSSCGTSCVNTNNKMVLTQTVRNVGGSTQNVRNTYLDWFDRPLVTSAMMPNSAYDRNEIQYDHRGNVHQQSAPCTFVSCAVYWTTYYYDLLNRVIESQRPISATNGTLQTSMIGYAGRTKALTDPQGKITTTTNLVTGNLARTKDNNGYYVNINYDAFGSAVLVTDSLSNTLNTMTYDYGLLAFQRSSKDADLGPRASTYDALGELTAYTDAKGNAFSVTYDALSRPRTRTEPDLTTSWTWGSTAASFNIGKLQNVAASSSVGTYSEAYGYDSKTRLSTETYTIPGDAAYTFSSSYNATTGLLDTLQYPVSTSSYQMKLQYSYLNGILQQISDVTTGTHYWTANTVNPRGQITQEALGNGVVANHSFDAVTGFVGSIQAGLGGGAALQNNSYLFDEVGNLTQRQDNNVPVVTENVYPDSLYRLDHTVGDSNTQMTYDGMGRILTWAAYGKATVTNDFTTRQSGCTYYTNSQLHAVRKSTAGAQPPQSFCYDANGNMTNISASGITLGSVAWTSFNQPSDITSGTTTGQLFYNANHQRYKQIANYAGSPETTFYIGGLLEKVINSSGTAYRHYIPAGNNLVLYTRSSTGSNLTYYITKDHLGSSAVITDHTGAFVVKEKFGAQGLNENTPTDQATIAGITRHEFTGQEQIDNTGVLLTNMNGRIYSPIGSLFFSPDPYVPNPGNTQSFNRYSYVNNNPLSRIDPTGFDETLPDYLVTCCSSSGGGFIGDIVGFFEGLFSGDGGLSAADQKLSNAGLLGVKNLPPPTPAGQQVFNNPDGSIQKIVGTGTVSTEGVYPGGYVINSADGGVLELVSTAKVRPSTAAQSQTPIKTRCPSSGLASFLYGLNAIGQSTVTAGKVTTAAAAGVGIVAAPFLLTPAAPGAAAAEGFAGVGVLVGTSTALTGYVLQDVAGIGLSFLGDSNPLINTSFSVLNSIGVSAATGNGPPSVNPVNPFSSAVNNMDQSISSCGP